MLYFAKPLGQIQPKMLSYLLTQVGIFKLPKMGQNVPIETSPIITGKIGRNLFINFTKREGVNSITFQWVMNSQCTQPDIFSFPEIYLCGEGRG